MIKLTTIAPGNWKEYQLAPYGLWMHRLARALKADIKQLPERTPQLPWPVQPLPIERVRQHNRGLLAEGPLQNKRRESLSSYVPKTIDLETVRTEVYRAEGKEDFLYRIKFSWDRPRPWSIEAVVDPGSRDYLRFFREVTIRLPIKAKICCELTAGADGQWRGACRRVKKLNARQAIATSTKRLLQDGQQVPAPVKSQIRTACRPDVNGTNHPQGLRPFPGSPPVCMYRRHG